jgi:uncharacterized membrane protein YidH (DUF202 family)
MFSREGLLGAASSNRGYVNTMTMGVAFVMSIMVINNYRQCEQGKGYPKNNTFVSMSYALAIVILIACCLLFGYDLAVMAKLV